MIGNIIRLRADPDWVHMVKHIDNGINCACCNGFMFRLYKTEAYRMIYGRGANSMPGLHTDFTPEELRLFLNVVYERRYFFGNAYLHEDCTSLFVLSDIVNVRRLPDSDFAEVLLI